MMALLQEDPQGFEHWQAAFSFALQAVNSIVVTLPVSLAEAALGSEKKSHMSSEEEPEARREAAERHQLQGSCMQIQHTHCNSLDATHSKLSV